jgi:hypothetical protein
MVEKISSEHVPFLMRKEAMPQRRDSCTALAIQYTQSLDCTVARYPSTFPQALPVLAGMWL